MFRWVFAALVAFVIFLTALIEGCYPTYTDISDDCYVQAGRAALISAWYELHPECVLSEKQIDRIYAHAVYVVETQSECQDVCNVDFKLAGCYAWGPIYTCPGFTAGVPLADLVIHEESHSIWGMCTGREDYGLSHSSEFYAVVQRAEKLLDVSRCRDGM